MIVAGRPIAEAHTWDEEAALLFARQAQQTARSFVRLRQLQQWEDTAREHIEAARSTIEVSESELSRFQEADGDSRTASSATKPSSVLLGLALVMLVASIAMHIGGLSGLGHLLMVACVGSGGAGLVLVARDSNAVTRRRQETSHESERVREKIRVSQGVIADAEATLQKVAEERGQTSPRPVVHAVGRVYHMLRRVDLAGYSVLLDEAGATGEVPLRVPDLAANPESVARVRQLLDSARGFPVLLRSTGHEPSTLGTLHGEENQLGEALSSFTSLVEAVPLFEERIPLIPSASPLAQFVTNDGADLHACAEDKDVPGPRLQRAHAADLQARVQRITELAQRLRTAGGDVGGALRDVQTGLTETLELYRSMRTESMTQVQRGLAEVLARSDLPYVTYYCPKCHRIPAYLLRRAGLDLSTVEDIPMAELLAGLQRDPEAKMRIEEDPALLDGIGAILDALAELRATQHALAQHQNDPAVAASLQNLRVLQSRQRAVDAQVAQNLEQFHAAIRHVLTGNARPVLELSRASRLLLDPDDGSWTCQACGTRFDDPAEARMGRMLRVKDELLMPLWNQLWAEKDDFRKAELFRTNEQLQRLMEKEVSALREVAEQYRADMRPVRENLILAISEAEGKRKQLDATVRSLAALGALQEDEVADRQRQLANMAGGDFDELKRSAGNKETMLNLEPQNQMSRRPPPSDPIRVLLRPEELFEYRQQASD